MNIAPKQNNIPEPVKVIVRREAGFGCCKCGCPILQYHHIIPLEIEIHNRPEDMMALCIYCHDMCTKGAIKEIEQRALKANPRNIQLGYTDGQLKINQDFCAITCGSCIFFGESIPFSIDNIPLLKIGINEGRLVIFLSLFDEEDRSLLEIINNDWISGDSTVWDLWSSYQKIKIKTKLGDIRLDIDASVIPVRLKAKLNKHKKMIEISPSKITSVGGNGGHLSIGNIAAYNTNFNFNTQDDTITIGSGAVIHFEADFKKKLEWGTSEMRKLLSK